MSSATAISQGSRSKLLSSLHRGIGTLEERRKAGYIAEAVHISLHLPAPNEKDLARYVRAAHSGMGTDIAGAIRTAAAQPYVEAMLEVRTKPLPKKIKSGYEDVAATIENLLTQALFVDGSAAKEFHTGEQTVAKSMSRLLALYYEEESVATGLTQRLTALLPYLSLHLQAETALAVDSKFTAAGRNLSKHSIFEIQETLERLQNHPDEIVRSNARSILSAALHNGNLSLADSLANGAQQKFSELGSHPDEIVRSNARSIMSTALNKGNLPLADSLAKGAQQKLRELGSHPDEIVRANARSIMSAALHNGNLSLAERIANEVSRNPADARSIIHGYLPANGD